MLSLLPALLRRTLAVVVASSFCVPAWAASQEQMAAHLVLLKQGQVLAEFLVERLDEGAKTFTSGETTRYVSGVVVGKDEVRPKYATLRHGVTGSVSADQAAFLRNAGRVQLDLSYTEVVGWKPRRAHGVHWSAPMTEGARFRLQDDAELGKKMWLRDGEYELVMTLIRSQVPVIEPGVIPDWVQELRSMSAGKP